MFAAALKKVENFTLPVVTAQIFADGTISAGCGTFIVVNTEGWILTAAHIIQHMLVAEQHKPFFEKYRIDRQAIESRPHQTIKERSKAIRKLTFDPKWIVTHSVIWGLLPGKITQFHCDFVADIALGKLEPFDPSSIKVYPTFHDPAKEMPAGTSLCRLGHPFHNVSATYDQTTNCFNFGQEVFPVPRFPNDGIHTRIAILKDPNGARQVKFVETSTPGLRGQSGGPVFDVRGNIWGMQSQTHSLPLGFSPSVKQGSKEVVEHQFMHVGFASHVEEIIRMFNQYGVSFTLAP